MNGDCRLTGQKGHWRRRVDRFIFCPMAHLALVRPRSTRTLARGSRGIKRDGVIRARLPIQLSKGFVPGVSLKSISELRDQSLP